MNIRAAAMACAFVTGAVLLAIPLAAQQPRPPDHDFSRWAQVIHNRLAGHLQGGYAFAVAQHGTIVASDTFGWARTPSEKIRPAMRWTPRTQMAIASVSKTITAIALLRLWDERHHDFSFDDPFWPYVQRLFPDVRPDVKKVTLRQLLLHQSGITNKNDAQTEADVRALLKQPLEFQPGTGILYHNNNYMILRYVIEQMAHAGYTPYIEQHVLRPIGVTDMDTRAPHPLQISTYLKLGVRRPGYPFDWDRTSSAGAAGWYGSVTDLITLLTKLQQVLSHDAREEMWKSGIGWDRLRPGLGKAGDFGADYPEGAGEAHSAIAMYHDDVRAVLLINCVTPVAPLDMIDEAWTKTKPAK